MKLRMVVPFLGLVLAAITWTACKQGEGDRCQIDDDCKSGLVCNQALLVCATNRGQGFDALPPLDAPDAAVTIDAPIDAPIDSPP